MPGLSRRRLKATAAFRAWVVTKLRLGTTWLVYYALLRHLLRHGMS